MLKISPANGTLLCHNTNQDCQLIGRLHEGLFEVRYQIDDIHHIVYFVPGFSF